MKFRFVDGMYSLSMSCVLSPDAPGCDIPIMFNDMGSHYLVSFEFRHEMPLDVCGGISDQRPQSNFFNSR
jgi:hypothetical protein